MFDPARRDDIATKATAKPPYPRTVTATCPDCGKPYGPARRKTETITGREVCEDCGARLLGHTVGAALHPDSPIAGAIATEGWWRRVRASRRRKQAN